MAQQRVVRVGLVQMRCLADPAANDRNAAEKIRQAAAQGAQIVCLPELFRSSYFCQVEDHANFALAEPVPGPTTRWLSDLARQLGVVIVAGLFERRTAGLYHNTAVVLDTDGRLLGKYRKMHVPDDPLYYEKFYFTPGDLGFRVFSTRFARIGTLICWDQWFPEAARITALRGAELLCYPTAIGWHPSEKCEYGETQRESWELIQRSHALANGCFVVSVNRTGHEGPPDGGLEFWGSSFVADPSGSVVARGPVDEEAVMVVSIDLAQIDEARVHWPFLRDRRIDAYGEITQYFADDDQQCNPESMPHLGASLPKRERPTA